MAVSTDSVVITLASSSIRRWSTNSATTFRATVNCEILHTLYVRSNGDVPCNDDAGENVLLGRVAPHGDRWSASSLLFNHRYRHIREALTQGRMPWPDACPNCAFFRPDEPVADPLARRFIRKVQIEPSLACRLRCPGCSGRLQVQVRSHPLVMDLRLFERLLRSLCDEGFSVAEFEYCGQGEPLLHPQFGEFVRLARAYFPATHQRLITSGDFDYRDATGGEHLDEIMVSCDGVFPESYVRYRVGGCVERPVRFMRDALVPVGRTAPTVVWKYILFEWNDSPDELWAAQQSAHDIGVQALLFVYTHSAGKSRRFTPENPADLPVHMPGVVTNATPIHYRFSHQPKSLVA